MNKYFLYPFLVMPLWLLVGCVSWTATTGKFCRPSLGYRIATPQQWHQRKIGSQVQLTKNGTDLECLYIDLWEWGDTLTTGEVTLSRNLLPHEIQQLLLDYICAKFIGFDLKVVSQDVIVLDSAISTRTVFTYMRGDGVRIKADLICCPRDRRLYTIFYPAPERYYYDKYEKKVRELVSSFRFLKSAGGTRR